MFYGRFSGIREREPGGVLNILLRACRCARVWFVRKRSGTVKIPAGWDEKYSGRMEFFIGWHEKKSGNTPRGREKIFVRTENSFRKMRIFPLKSPGKSAKMMKTGRKISFPARGKTWKLSRWRGKTCPKLGNGNRKKRIFLLKKFRRSIKNTGMRWKISQFRSGKGKKNYSDEAKKSQKTDDPDGKSSRFFVGGRKNTEMHGKRSRKIYRIIRKKHERYTADRNKFCHWRTVGLKKRIFPPEKSREKSKKIRNPHKKIPKMLKKHAGIFSGFCTKNILFCTNSWKFCTKT